MKWVIVDTNVIFSALLKKESKIKEVLSNTQYNFCAPNFLVVEIFKHHDKIIRRSKASEEEVTELLALILSKVKFINDELNERATFFKAYEFCKDVDEKDTPFIALTLQLSGTFWTGDLKLKKGLSGKGFDDFFKI